jgi:hypothetical protein
MPDEIGDEGSKDRKDHEENDESETGQRHLVALEAHEEQLPWSLADIGFTDIADMLFKRRDYVGCSLSHSISPVLLLQSLWDLTAAGRPSQHSRLGA